jgi:hypothetical protein
MVLPTRVFAELAVWTAGLEVLGEGALGALVAGAEPGADGLTTVAVLVLVLWRVAVTFP